MFTYNVFVLRKVKTELSTVIALVTHGLLKINNLLLAQIEVTNDNSLLYNNDLCVFNL